MYGVALDTDRHRYRGDEHKVHNSRVRAVVHGSWMNGKQKQKQKHLEYVSPRGVVVNNVCKPILYNRIT